MAGWTVTKLCPTNSRVLARSDALDSTLARLYAGVYGQAFSQNAAPQWRDDILMQLDVNC